MVVCESSEWLDQSLLHGYHPSTKKMRHWSDYESKRHCTLYKMAGWMVIPTVDPMENAPQRAPRGAKLPSHSDLRHEAHVQHPICFVQHEIAHAAETLPPDAGSKVSRKSVWTCIFWNSEWEYMAILLNLCIPTVWHGRNYIKKKQEETGLT